MKKKHRNTNDTMVGKRYGSTQLQQRIIRLGDEGELTVGAIIELCDNEKRKAVDEINKLREMGLIQFDTSTMDEKGGYYPSTRLHWVHTKGTPLPLDPGDIIHGPVVDFLYEQQDQFNNHYRNQVCQKCGRTCERMHCVNLDCELMEGDDLTLECIAPPFDMIALCEECHSQLKEWLNIAIQDSMKT